MTDKGGFSETIDGAHVHPSTRAILDLTVQDRMVYLYGDRWVPYKAADDAIGIVRRWLASEPSKRPECLWIAARSGNGKSRLLDRIESLFPPDDGLRGANIYAPVIRLQTPPSGNAIACYEGICALLNQPVRRNAREKDWRNGAVEVLSAVKTRVLMWDEINSLLSGTIHRKREFLFALKYLSNELKLNVIVAGTPESLSLLRLSDQILNRYKLIPLPPWKDGPKLRQLLADIESLIPLRKKSGLSAKAIASQIYSPGLDTIGAISNFLNEAAEVALKTGVEQITPEIIAQCRPQASRNIASLMKTL